MRKKSQEEKIINASIKVFAEKGFNKATVQGIVREAGISRGTFYLYYKNKKEVLFQLLDNFMREVIQAFADIRYDTLQTFEDFRNHVKKVSHVFVELVLNNQELTRIFYREGVMAGTFLDEKIKVYLEHLLDISERFLNFCMERDIIRKVNSKIVSLIASGMVKELLYQYVEGTLEIDPNEIVEEGTDFYVKALKKDR